MKTWKEHTLFFKTDKDRDFAENWIYDNFALEDSYCNDLDDDTSQYTFYTSTELDKREIALIKSNVSPIRSMFNS